MEFKFKKLQAVICVYFLILKSIKCLEESDISVENSEATLEFYRTSLWQKTSEIQIEKVGSDCGCPFSDFKVQ